jgi:hypothetical protein
VSSTRATMTVTLRYQYPTTVNPYGIRILAWP